MPRRRDTGMGHASGCGYDKRSAAVNKALYDLPLLQTLLLWRGFRHTSPWSEFPLYGQCMSDGDWDKAAGALKALGLDLAYGNIGLTLSI